MKQNGNSDLNKDFSSILSTSGEPYFTKSHISSYERTELDGSSKFQRFENSTKFESMINL